MNEGQSFSFLSFSSRNPPSLTFHEIEPTSSRYEIKDSMINDFPGKKIPMANHLQIILLLQAAEIERLTISLHAYRTKYKKQQQRFKQLSNVEKNYDSFQNQADQLLNLKQQFQLREKKMNSFVKSQEGSIADMSNYLQKLESKYKRSLKYIEEIVSNNQNLEIANNQLRQQLFNTQQKFEAFKIQSVRQYQYLRQQYDTAKSSSFSFQSKKLQEEKARFNQILQREEAKFKSQREKYEILLHQEKDKNLILGSQIERFKVQNQEYRRMVDQVSSKYREAQNHNENSLTLLGVQIQRLKGVVKQKTNNLSEADKIIHQLRNFQTNSQEEILLLRREIERGRQKASLYEQQINKQNNEIVRLSNTVSTLSTKINEMALIIDQKNSELRIKQNKMNLELRSHSQNLMKSQLMINKQKQQLRQQNFKLVQQLTRLKQQIQNRQLFINKKQNEFSMLIKQLQIQRQKTTQQGGKLEQQKYFNQKNRMEINRLSNELVTYQNKIKEVIDQNNQLIAKIKKQETENILLKQNRDQIANQTGLRFQQFQNKIRGLSQIKLNLEIKNENLAKNLQRYQSDRQSKKGKSFQQLYDQIQMLCSKIVQREAKIDELNQKMRTNNEQINKANQEIQYLKQMLTNTFALIQSCERNRKEDKQSLYEQIKKLFKGQFRLLQELKESNYTMSNSSVIQKQMIQTSHSYILKMKDQEMLQLRQKIHELEMELSKSQNEEIINKMIIITKQNSELKGKITKSTYELDYLRKEVSDLKNQLQRSKQYYNHISKQKQQMYIKVTIQLDEVNNLLYQEKHSKLEMQSKIKENQAIKRQTNMQLTNRENLINQIKEQLKSKSEQLIKYTELAEEQIHANRCLNNELQQIKKLKRIQNLKIQGQLKEHYREISTLRMQLQNYNKIRREWEVDKMEQQKNNQILSNYKQKVNVMNGELIRLQQIIEELKRKNSQFSNKNYEFSLILEKKELNQQKFNTLNLELNRLQQQNLNLSQQIQACRLQICQQTTQQKQIEQNNMLFVLVFTQIQSLREQLTHKEKTISELRRQKIQS